MFGKTKVEMIFKLFLEHFYTYFQNKKNCEFNF